MAAIITSLLDGDAGRLGWLAVAAAMSSARGRGDLPGARGVAAIITSLLTTVSPGAVDSTRASTPARVRSQRAL